MTIINCTIPFGVIRDISNYSKIINEILKFEAKEIDVISLRGSNVGRYKKREAKSDYTIYNIGPDT
ncbi:MAG: hypothetical protein ACFE9R_08720, partial [Candidatus Hermodarchaeota archaeon]